MPDIDTVFTPGVDYTALFGGYASALKQGVELAVPNGLRGMVYYSETQPQTTGWYAFNLRGVWVKPSTGEAHIYKTGVGFVNIAANLPANTITTGMLQNGAITLAKIATTGGTPGQSLLIDTAGTAVVWGNPITNLVGGGLPVAKVAPGVNGDFLKTVGGIATWQTFTGADINALLATTRLTSTSIQPGLPTEVLSNTATGDFSVWRQTIDTIASYTLPISALQLGTGNSSKALFVNAAGTGWEYKSIDASVVPALTKSYTSSLLPVASATAFAHNLTVTPTVVHSVLSCFTEEGGYSVNDQIPIEQAALDYDDWHRDGPWCAIVADTVNIKITVSDYLTGSDREWFATRKDNGVRFTLVAENWRLKITAYAP